MTTTIQAPNQEEKTSPQAPATIQARGRDTVSPEEAEMAFARHIMQANPELEYIDGMPPVVRQMVSRMNLGDDRIRRSLGWDIEDHALTWAPHDFEHRTDRLKGLHPNPHESEADRRGIATEFVLEASQALREFAVDCDWENHRLVQVVATAIRGEIRRCLAYLDDGCPVNVGEEPTEEARPSNSPAIVWTDAPLADEFLQADIKKQLLAAQALTGRVTNTPADMVPAILDLSGFRIKFQPQSKPFMVDRKNVCIRPGLSPAKTNLVLAQAIGYIRLHMNYVAEILPKHVAEFERYASLLLIPERDLERLINDHLETEEGELVEIVRRRFCVPRKLARLRLHLRAATSGSDAIGLHPLVDHKT